jgi:hypothetical protein
MCAIIATVARGENDPLNSELAEIAQQRLRASAQCVGKNQNASKCAINRD